MFWHHYTRQSVFALVFASTVLGTSLLLVAIAAFAISEIASINTNGQQGNDISGRFAGPAISGDGQVVAFDSIATTLVPGDTNAMADVFVHDRKSNTTERISVSSAGAQANGTSTRPVLDLAGNLVAFDSSASNLVGGDTNSALDVFVHDRTTKVTERISVSSDEVPGNAGSFIPSISADGRFVSFTSDATNLIPGGSSGVRDVFVRDRVAGTTEVVSVSSTGEPSNSSSGGSAISPDGRWVAFSSFATNLVPGDDTNGQFDVFIHDRQTGLTELVSVSSDETLGNGLSTQPSVSEDGRFVAFWSNATNLVPGDTNEVNDIFVRDRIAGTTERVSVSSSEEQADGSSPEPGVRGFTASGPDITPDGRFVAFYSSATNLVSGDTNTCPQFFQNPPGRCPDAFVRDRVAGTTVRVNVAADGTQANDRTADAVISDNGLITSYFSAAGNLVSNDTNTCPLFASFPGNCPDIFVHEEDGGGGGGDDADLVVTKSDSKDPIPVKTRLTYRIRVTNQGPAPATQVVLTDALPNGARFVAVTSSAGTCVRQGGSVVCDLGAIGAGHAVNITLDVLPVQTGTIQNTVTVDGVENDPAPGNNSEIETTLVVP